MSPVKATRNLIVTLAPGKVWAWGIETWFPLSEEEPRVARRTKVSTHFFGCQRPARCPGENA